MRKKAVLGAIAAAFISFASFNTYSEKQSIKYSNKIQLRQIRPIEKDTNAFRLYLLFLGDQTLYTTNLRHYTKAVCVEGGYKLITIPTIKWVMGHSYRAPKKVAWVDIKIQPEGDKRNTIWMTDSSELPLSEKECPLFVTSLGETLNAIDFDKTPWSYRKKKTKLSPSLSIELNNSTQPKNIEYHPSIVNIQPPSRQKSFTINSTGEIK